MSVKLAAVLQRQEETIKRIKDHTCRICDQEFPCYSRRPTTCQCRHDPVCFDCSEKLYTTHRYKLYESQGSCRMCRHHGRDCTHIPAEKDIHRLMHDLYVDTHCCCACTGNFPCRRNAKHECTCVELLTRPWGFMCQTCYHRKANGLKPDNGISTKNQEFHEAAASMEIKGPNKPTTLFEKERMAHVCCECTTSFLCREEYKGGQKVCMCIELLTHPGGFMCQSCYHAVPAS